MTQRVLLGKRSNGSYGLDVSAPGVDVMTAATKDMLFSSDWPHAGVIHQTGLIARGATASFPSLGYAPVAIVVIADGTGNTSVEFAKKVTRRTESSIEFVDKVLKEPMYEVGTNYITILDKTAFLSTPSFTARYIILRIPG